MKILFLNGSPNPNGNTAALAETLLAGHDYETLKAYPIKEWPQTKKKPLLWQQNCK